MAPQSGQVPPEEDVIIEKDNEKGPVKDRKVIIDSRQIYNNLKNFDYSNVIWRNVIAITVMHIFAMRGAYLLLTLQWKWQTLILTLFYGIMTLIGTTMGAHRLWAHRTYKARLPLRIILAVMQTTAWQRDIYDWVRDHRVHHKFSETDADPHNGRRGLFFSHMGWLMCRKHPEVVTSGKKVDFSDIFADPVVVFQRKYYVILSVTLSLLIPCFIPWYYWNETIERAFYIVVMLRYVLTLHGTWSVNSFAHWIGNRPFNSNIYPAQNKWVSLLTGGEGWHNYHHAFPYDYRAAELGGFTHLNVVASIIELCEKVGLAYDLRVPTEKAIQQQAKNCGDGSFQGLDISN